MIVGVYERRIRGALPDWQGDIYHLGEMEAMKSWTSSYDIDDILFSPATIPAAGAGDIHHLGEMGSHGKVDSLRLRLYDALIPDELRYSSA